MSAQTDGSENQTFSVYSRDLNGSRLPLLRPTGTQRWEQHQIGYVLKQGRRSLPQVRKNIKGFEKLFKMIASPQFCLKQRFSGDFDTSIVELAYEGINMDSLKEPLDAMVVNHPCLYRLWCPLAAFALAAIDREVPYLLGGRNARFDSVWSYKYQNA